MQTDLSLVDGIARRGGIGAVTTVTILADGLS